MQSNKELIDTQLAANDLNLNDNYIIIIFISQVKVSRYIFMPFNDDPKKYKLYFGFLTFELKGKPFDFTNEVEVEKNKRSLFE